MCLYDYPEGTLFLCHKCKISNIFGCHLCKFGRSGDGRSYATNLHSLQDGDSLEHLTGCVWGWLSPVAIAFQSSCLGNERNIITLTWQAHTCAHVRKHINNRGTWDAWSDSHWRGGAAPCTRRRWSPRPAAPAGSRSAAWTSWSPWCHHATQHHLQDAGHKHVNNRSDPDFGCLEQLHL